jgi:endonuclease/exonuclease/phosphatase family metal-dependent hydrolase
MNAAAPTFTALTYNIHRCRGTDGRYDPRRVAQVLAEMNADVVGLQEVDTSLMVPLCERRHEHSSSDRGGADPTSVSPEDETCGELHQLDFLSAQTGCQAVPGLVMVRGNGEYGNALLTRHEIKEVRRIDLTVRGTQERRGALDVDLLIRGHPVRVLVTHLGLKIWERYFQVARLLKALGQSRTEQIVIMGDFNLLLSVLPKLRRFYQRLGHTPTIPTFPSWFPVVSFDRIWAQPARSLVKVERYQTPLTRVASDHLPLVATILLEDKTEANRDVLSDVTSSLS